LIRAAVAGDVDGIMDAHLEAIRELCSAAYAPDQISAWTSGGKNPARYLPGIAAGRFSVALLGETVVGFSELDLVKGELCGMFVAPAHARQGIGRALLAAVEARAVRQGVGRLDLKATLNAVDFYRALGFVLDEMSTFELRSGVTVPCAVMHKDLESGKRPRP
jgi:putative acetyltransferase